MLMSRALPALKLVHIAEYVRHDLPGGYGLGIAVDGFQVAPVPMTAERVFYRLRIWLLFNKRQAQQRSEVPEIAIRTAFSIFSTCRNYHSVCSEHLTRLKSSLDCSKSFRLSNPAQLSYRRMSVQEPLLFSLFLWCT